MRRIVVVLVLLATAWRAAVADPPPPGGKPAGPPSALAPVPEKSPTPEQAADAALAAIKAGDTGALSAIAAKDEPDPWLVADELLARGAGDAAALFAKAAPRVDVERLPAYVASGRGKPVDAERRKALVLSNVALFAKNPKAALDAIGVAPTSDVGDVVGIRLEFGRGLALGALERLDESVKAFLRAADAAEALGWLSRAATALFEGGVRAFARPDLSASLKAYERSLAVEERRGFREGIAWTLAAIGNVHRALGNYAKALAYDERALALQEARETHAGNLAVILGNVGLDQASRGNFAKALEYHKRALQLAEAAEDRAGVARALGNIGNVYESLANYERAREHYDRALKMYEALGDRRGMALVLGNIGAVQTALGSYAQAIASGEQALKLTEELGDRAGVASNLQNIGVVHAELGNARAALGYYEQALGIYEAMGDRSGVARILGNIGNSHDSLGDPAKALAYHERALEIATDLGDREGMATSLSNMGCVHEALRNYEQALRYDERALRLTEELGDRAGTARNLGNIASIHNSLGDPVNALLFLDRATREAERLRANAILVWNLKTSARVRLQSGDFPRALDAAHRAATILESLLTGLADEQGATAREQYASVFEIGALAAARLLDAGETAYFVESGRAGSLVESLGGKQAMRWQGVPDALRAVQIDARSEESAALSTYTDSLATDDRPRVLAASKGLQSARDKVRQVVDRIQREARREANIWYPRAATMEEIQKWPGVGDALVLYAFCLNKVLALVLTNDDARIVSLCTSADAAAACEALHADDLDADATPALARLRALLVDPLTLPASTKRLLVSPEGPLSYVPFAAVAPDRTIVYEPSGTTYGLLLEEATKRGEGVLALGDPDYAGAREGSSQAVYWGRRPLVALPATREEASRVGTVALLGADASEGGLRAALVSVKGGRWRAVHFACHGLIDVERPTLSSLALSRDAGNDGFLTALEVLDLDVPADLAVLSACETGKGKVVKGEGIVGLTRAFMFAGSPRVICSLWKVDDEATRALMTKFYELWNPKDGVPGVPTAQALRMAQDFVRSQPKWKHPYYWAAWVLWGLPT